MHDTERPRPTRVHPVCEPAVRRWATISVAALVALAWGGALLVQTGHTEGPVPFLLLAGTLGVMAAHFKLYRAVRDDIVMEPEANARFLQRLRWFGPAGALELLFFIHSARSPQ
jgi:hypothetical protein